jgi:hypothetical protein
MKEHYQPSSSINLISSGWKEREKEQKKIFHWFTSVKDLRKRKKSSFFFLLLLFLSTNQLLLLSSDMSESGMAYIEETK